MVAKDDPNNPFEKKYLAAHPSKKTAADRKAGNVTSKPGGFNPYAAGAKHYGGGRSAPNIGAVDKTGYKVRSANLKGKARREAILKRLAAMRASRQGGGK